MKKASLALVAISGAHALHLQAKPAGQQHPVVASGSLLAKQMNKKLVWKFANAKQSQSDSESQEQDPAMPETDAPTEMTGAFEVGEVKAMDHKLYANAKITKKYDDLASVNEVLFMIACRTKHNEDVVGMAKEKLGKGFSKAALK